MFFVYSPFGAAEPKAVGKLSPQRSPELGLFILGQLQQRVVVLLQPLVLLDHLGESLVGAMASTVIATTTASATPSPAASIRLED